MIPGSTCSKRPTLRSIASPETRRRNPTNPNDDFDAKPVNINLQTCCKLPKTLRRPRILLHFPQLQLPGSASTVSCETLELEHFLGRQFGFCERLSDSWPGDVGFSTGKSTTPRSQSSCTLQVDVSLSKPTWKREIGETSTSTWVAGFLCRRKCPKAAKRIQGTFWWIGVA